MVLPAAWTGLLGVQVEAAPVGACEWYLAWEPRLNSRSGTESSAKTSTMAGAGALARWGEAKKKGLVQPGEETASEGP